MRVQFAPAAWDEYTEWLEQDKKKHRKINQLIKSIKRTPYEGLGRPEALKHELSGFWSRRIDSQHRLVYRILEDDGGDILQITGCRHHYSDSR